MKQPIIDPEKVGAWMGSMNDTFAGTAIGLWLAAGLIVGFLLVVVLLASWDARHSKRGRA